MRPLIPTSSTPHSHLATYLVRDWLCDLCGPGQRRAPDAIPLFRAYAATGLSPVLREALVLLADHLEGGVTQDVTAHASTALGQLDLQLLQSELPGPRQSLEELEPKIKAYFRRHPQATQSDAAKALHCSRGLISKSKAWQTVRAKRRSEKKPALRRIGSELAYSDQAVADWNRRDEQPCDDSSAQLEALISEQMRDGRSDAYRPRMLPDGSRAA